MPTASELQRRRHLAESRLLSNQLLNRVPPALLLAMFQHAGNRWTSDHLIGKDDRFTIIAINFLKCRFLWRNCYQRLFGCCGSECQLAACRSGLPEWPRDRICLREASRASGNNDRLVKRELKWRAAPVFICSAEGLQGRIEIIRVGFNLIGIRNSFSEFIHGIGCSIQQSKPTAC